MIVAWWCVCAGGMAVAADQQHEVAAEILRRWPELPGVRVEVPTSVIREYVSAQLRPPERLRPPVATIITNQTHKLTIGEKTTQLDVTLRVTVLDIVLPGRVALLPRAVAFRDVRIGGKPHKLKPIGRWLWWSPSKTGTFTITARATLEPTHSGPVRSVALTRRPSTLTEIAVVGQKAWTVTSPDAVGRVTGTAKGTSGSLALRPGPNVRASWREPLPTVEHAPALSTTCQVACDFAPAAVVVNARIEVLIQRGKTDRLTLELPPNADQVSVEGPDVRRIDGRGGARTVHLRRNVRGRTRLAVRFEIPRTSAKGRTGLGYFGIQGARATGGRLIVSNSAGGELLEDEAVALQEEALFNVPEDVLALSSERPLLVYTMHRGRWRLACDIVLSSEVKMPPTLIDRAKHTIIRRADGNIIGRVEYEVRNRNRQFLRVRLPKETTVLVALVDDKSVAITSGAANEIVLPLKKSIATIGGLVSFPVEVVYTQTSPGLGLQGELTHPLPRVDAPIAHTTCDMYLPEDIAFFDWRGTLKHLTPAETDAPRDTMVIGRAHRAKPRDSVQNYVRSYDSDSVSPGGKKPSDDTPAIKSSSPRRPDPTTLATNYYRAGVKAYKEKDLDRAKQLLDKAAKTAPDSAAARNAIKLKSNLAAVRGKDKSFSSGNRGSRLYRAQTQQIQKQVQSGDEGLLLEQRDMLRRADQLANRGDAAGAAQVYGGVVVLSDELKKRGQDGKELAAVRERARKGLVKQLSIQGKATKQARRLAETRRRVRDIAGKANIALGANGGLGSLQSGRQAAARPDGGVGGRGNEVDRFERQVEEQENVLEALKEVTRSKPKAPSVRPAAKPKRRGGKAAIDQRVVLQRARSQAGQSINFGLSSDGRQVSISAQQKEIEQLEGGLSGLERDTDKLQKLRGEGEKLVRELTATRRRNKAKEDAARKRAASLVQSEARDAKRAPVKPGKARGPRRPATGGQADPSKVRAAGIREEARLRERILEAREKETKLSRGVQAALRDLQAMRMSEPEAPRQPALRTAGTQIEVETVADAKWKKELQNKLEQPVSFDFIATPLEDVVAFLRSIHKVNIVVDQAVLAKRDDLDLTLRLEKVKFKDGLDWICRLLNLTYDLREGAIFITTRERLFQFGEQRTVHHDEKEWKPLVGKLEQPVSFDFIATPFEDVVAFLSSVNNTKIVVDPKAVEGRKDLDLTLQIEKVPLKDALFWTCRQLDLGYAVRDGAIFISTPDDRLLPPKKTVTRIYDVTDLTIDIRNFRPNAQAISNADLDEAQQTDLTDFIADNVSNATWGDNNSDGGANTITYRNGTLVVTHTPEVQEQIREFVATIKPNRGQKIGLAGANVAYFDSQVTFKKGKNDARYAVVDEGELQHMLDVGQKAQRKADFDENRISGEVAVGNATVIANNEAMTVTESDERGNWVNYRDNRIVIPHGKYLLINNDNRFVTVVGATEKHHWTERIKPKRIVVEAPPRIDLPLVGRVVTFEKALIEPEDKPVLQADYVVLQK